MKQYLFLFDFDGTLAKTFKPSPNRVGVNEAYKMAVQRIFGIRGAEVFDAVGGLKNRAPSEPIADMLAKEPALVDAARKFFEQDHPDFSDLVPPGKGIAVKWDEKEPGKPITEMMVRHKLAILMEEIGAAWPEPCAGVPEFFAELKTARQSGLDLDVAIVSSGHDRFIAKVFESWGIEPPDLLVTDDDMRGRSYPVDAASRVKPSSYLFSLAHYRWMQKQGEWIRDIDFNFADESRSRAVFIGDDINKDGQMALNSDLPFLWFNPEGKPSGNYKNGEYPGEIIEFSDWRVLAEMLHSEKLRAGAPIREVLSDMRPERDFQPEARDYKRPGNK